MHFTADRVLLKKKKKNLHRKQAEHSVVLVVTDVTLWQRKQ